MPTVQRAKNKLNQLQNTAFRKKRKLSAASHSSLSDEGNSSVSSFKKFESIHSMVRDRHQFEDQTQKMKNTWSYFENKVIDDKKKTRLLVSKQKKIASIVHENKSYKKFLSKV